MLFRRKIKYYLPYEICYLHPSGKTVTVPKGYPSDGATGATDIWTEAFWVHDYITDDPNKIDAKKTHKFDDGTPLTSLDASFIIGDILMKEGRTVRSFFWYWATRLFGPEF